MLDNQREFLQFYKCNEAIEAEKYEVMKKKVGFVTDGSRIVANSC